MSCLDMYKTLEQEWSSLVINDELKKWNAFKLFSSTTNYTFKDIIEFLLYLNKLQKEKDYKLNLNIENLIKLFFLIKFENFLKKLNDNILISLDNDSKMKSRRNVLRNILYKWVNLTNTHVSVFVNIFLNDNVLKSKVFKDFLIYYLSLDLFKTKKSSIELEIKLLETSTDLKKATLINDFLKEKIYVLHNQVTSLESLLDSKNTIKNPELLNEKILCIVCISGLTEMIGKSCKHLSCCKVCSTKLQKCPICRSSDGFEQIFFN